MNNKINNECAMDQHIFVNIDIIHKKSDPIEIDDIDKIYGHILDLHNQIEQYYSPKLYLYCPSK